MEMAAGDPNESHIRQPVEITSKPEVLENIHCSESLVPDSQDHNNTEDANGADDCGSTLQEVNSGIKEEDENKPGKDDDLAASDQVSSTTESFSTETDQQNSHGLPSINHQSVVVPNMEPYLEEGSLDGEKEEMHPPDVSSTESESNKDTSNVDSTSSQNLTNEVPTSMEESVVDTCKQEQATEEEITGQEMQLPDDEPTSITLENPQGVPEESVTSEVELVRSENEAIIEERDEQADVPADCEMEAEETITAEEEVSVEQSTQPEHMDSSAVPLEEPTSVQPITDAEMMDIPQENSQQNVVLDKSSALDSTTEPTELMLDQQYLEQAQYINTAPPEQITNQPMQPLEQAEPEQGQEQVPEEIVKEETNQMMELPTEQNPEQLTVQTMEQAQDQQIEHQIPVEIMEQGVTNQLLEHEPEEHMQDHQMHNHLLEQQTPEQQVANQQILEHEILDPHAMDHQISEEQMLQHEALERHIMQQQMPVQLPNQIMEHISNQQVPLGHEMIADQSLMSAQPDITGGTISNQAVITDHQTGTVQIQDQSMILEQQIQVHEQEEMENTAAVCEADTSASYSGHQLAQSVYVVDESGGLTLNSINRDGSMSAYHNSEAGASAGHMLVEMAPMSTDGSYVNTHTQVKSLNESS